MPEGDRKGGGLVKAIYVAGASSEADLVKRYAETLESRGWRITYRWFDDVIEHRDKGIPDSALTPDQALNFAVCDRAGIMTADVVWFVMPTQKGSEGAPFEAGLATGLQKRVIVSGDFRRLIFTTLAEQRFATHDEALAWLGAAR
jgi:nucleoside 2-deoxyribosyltransferase